jgi:hypothetical protein
MTGGELAGPLPPAGAAGPAPPTPAMVTVPGPGGRVGPELGGAAMVKVFRAVAVLPAESLTSSPTWGIWCQGFVPCEASVGQTSALVVEEKA